MVGTAPKSFSKGPIAKHVTSCSLGFANICVNRPLPWLLLQQQDPFSSDDLVPPAPDSAVARHVSETAGPGLCKGVHLKCFLESRCDPPPPKEALLELDRETRDQTPHVRFPDG